MRRTLRSIAFAATALLATVTTLVAGAATEARVAAHPPWWRKLQAGVEAFGGLIGVALIVLVAVVLLLAADRWMFDRAQRDDKGPGGEP